MSEIDYFIKHFQRASPAQNVIETFTRGCCYWFAYILCGRFPQARLMYDVVENHFVAEIDNKLYDITGDVTNEYNVIPWEAYSDKLHRERIIRDCINFVGW